MSEYTPTEPEIFAATTALGHLGVAVTIPMIRRALIAANEARDKPITPWTAPAAYSRQLSTEQELGNEIARVRHGQDVTASDLANRLRPWLAAHDAEVRAGVGAS